MVTRVFEALGTRFSITLFENEEGADSHLILNTCEEMVHAFDARYSRFNPDSFVSSLSRTVGRVEVEEELVSMLRLYQELNQATQGKINPCIGFSLEDIGYDAAYSLVPKEVVRTTPSFASALTIEDDTHISLHKKVLLDLGALGKGFIVDRVYDYVRSQSVARFLVDGSGDIRYFDEAMNPITCGLEHPRDTTQAIGTLALTGGALCASATNRRAWHGYNHYLDPERGVSPTDIVAVWVTAETAALADGLSSALFFVAPESLNEFSFEYLIVNRGMGIKKSTGFAADLFSS